MRYIKLTKNKFAMVDDDDFDYLSQFKWHVKHKTPDRWYAARLETINGSQKTIYMHKDVLKVSKEFDIDHKDRNGLNNQKYNLRKCTVSQNLMNRTLCNNTSGYKGVTWRKDSKKWQAKIANKYLGQFDDIRQAATAYDIAAVEMYGEFAYLNFPKKMY